ncbi:MAG: hypothetical protein ACOY3E_15950 [Pseudomonadota bacterium]
MKPRKLDGSVELTQTPKYDIKPLYKWLLGLAFIVLIGIPLGLMAESEWPRLLAQLQDPARLLRLVIMLVLGSVLPILAWRIQKQERLLIDDQGIRYNAPFSWWPTHSFQLRWSEVDQIVFVSGRRPALEGELRLFSSRGMQRLFPFRWHFQEVDWAERSPLLQLRQADAETMFARWGRCWRPAINR